VDNFIVLRRASMRGSSSHMLPLMIHVSIGKYFIVVSVMILVVVVPQMMPVLMKHEF
jgi:hypothetical protein